MSRKVYLIRAGQFFKIGVSGSVDKRLKQIQTGCPIKCEYVGYFPTDSPEEHEKNLHQQYSSALTHGEWFELGDDHIKHMIVENNLKYVLNPYFESTGESIKISASPELKKSRDLNSQIHEFEIIFENENDGYSLSNNGKDVIRRLIKKYGFDIVKMTFDHMSTMYDIKTAFDKLQKHCKYFYKYRRPVPDKLWSLYFKVKEHRDKSEASKLLKHVMDLKIDCVDEYMDVVKRVIESNEYPEMDKLFKRK